VTLERFPFPRLFMHFLISHKVIDVISLKMDVTCASAIGSADGKCCLVGAKDNASITVITWAPLLDASSRHCFEGGNVMLLEKE